MNLTGTIVEHTGNKSLLRAIQMSIVSQCHDIPLHIHAEGVRGTGKTTMLRAARQLLPPIVRIKGCIYNCHPAKPHCPVHRDLPYEQLQALGTETIPRPFLEISHSAKIGTIAGSIDIEKLTGNQPQAAILPGTIPQAHRGIIFIDEINRLADTSPEIADILLDVMGTKPGRIQIEETGLPSVEIPVSVSVWAASNPDEDPGSLSRIRKQLADRFDLSINVGRPTDRTTIKNILTQVSTLATAQPLYGATDILPYTEINLEHILIPEPVLDIVSDIYVNYNLESLRAIQTLLAAARLEALLSGKSCVDLTDIAKVIVLSLGHRTDPATLSTICKLLENTINGSFSPAAPAAQDKPPTSHIGPPAHGLKTRLAEIIDRLRRRLSFAAGGGVPATNGLDRGFPSVVKASNARVSSPPKTAVPLTELDEEQLITVGRKPNLD